MSRIKYLIHPVVLAVIFLRLSTAVYILFDPLWGSMAHFFMDAVDGAMMMGLIKTEKPYHKLDKYLDEAVYLCMLISAWKFGLFVPLLGLFIFRLIGTYLFLKNENRKFLILFPNFFEPVFFVGVGLNIRASWPFWSAIFVVQAARDYYLHYFGPKYIYRAARKHYLGRLFVHKQDAGAA